MHHQHSTPVDLLAKSPLRTSYILHHITLMKIVRKQLIWIHCVNVCVCLTLNTQKQTNTLEINITNHYMFNQYHNLYTQNVPGFGFEKIYN